ncbi:MAG: Rne/Rng family ribonuclease [Zetaproteobacteria bacterium]|nr:MAG: Rne/Rng family ribonuclease [Zetaproteobacteria bacterium]
MLINALHEEESRVAIVEDGYLQELDIESSQKTLTKSNIYKGRITKVEGSLQAAFVEYGAARQGFLPLNEIHPDYWKEGTDKNADVRKLNIQDILEPKQEILVQVVKEERGNKGAALTTFISLAGRYLVLSPNTNRGGISRKLSDEERKAMKAIISQLDVPESMGLIVRTAGKDQTLEALQRDYNYLRRLWDEIRIKSETAPTPTLIYLEGDLATRAIRDHFTEDIQEIWVDNHEVYTRTKQFVHAVLPGKEKLVKLYRGKKPLFRYYGIEAQCEEIHEREIRLPSGGSIVLDPTEALTSIDVNSSRATKGKHIDDTALATNLEAAEEIARQLRIRDIGGLIVIDFIDMNSRKHNQMVEETLRAACKQDKARIQIARISRFGLLEMSRQRIHPSVRESTTEVCQRCQGRGFVRTVESMALQMLTRMEDWAEKGKKPMLVVQVPSDTGEYLMNNKRSYIARIEDVYDIQITLQIRKDLEIPHYRIERQWTENNQQRIEVLEDTTKNKRPIRPGRKLKPLKPVVGIPTPTESSKEPTREKKEGPLTRLIRLILGSVVKEEGKKSEETAAKKPEPAARQAPKPASAQGQRRRRRRNRSGSKSAAGTSQKAQGSTEQAQTPASSTQTDTKAAGDGTSKQSTSGGQQRRRRRRRSAQQKPDQAAKTTDNANEIRETAEKRSQPSTVQPSADSRMDEQMQQANSSSTSDDAARMTQAVADMEDETQQAAQKSGQARRRRRRRRSRQSRPAGETTSEATASSTTQQTKHADESSPSGHQEKAAQPAPAESPTPSSSGGS